MLTDDCFENKVNNRCKAVKCKVNLKFESKSYEQCIMLHLQKDLHAEFYFIKFMAIVITLLFKVVKMKDCICIIFI